MAPAGSLTRTKTQTLHRELQERLKRLRAEQGQLPEQEGQRGDRADGATR